MKMILRFTLLLASSLLAFAHSSTAQHYHLDSTFATNGIDTFGGNVQAGIIHRPIWVVPQLDGKILMAGYSTNSATTELIRLKSNGAYDSTFNDSGIVRVTRGYTIENPASFLVYDTSKVIMGSVWLDVNTGWYYASVYNFNSNGTLNTGFGQGGVAHVNMTSVYGAVYCRSMAIGKQSDGKFVIYGSTQDHNTGYQIYALTRINANGTPDSTYGLNSTKICPYPILDTPAQHTTPLANSPSCGYMQTDNKFVCAGFFADSLDKYAGSQTFVVRHNMDGTPDMSFGEQNGVTILKGINSFYECTAMATDSAGNYYIFGAFFHSAAPFTDSNFTVTKLDHNGHRVTSYGYNGTAYLELHAANKYSGGFAVQKDGKVLIPNIYQAYNPNFADQFIVYRLDLNGKPDTSFNTGASFIGQRPQHDHDLCINAAAMPDGNVLLLGWDTLSATSVCMKITNKVKSTTNAVATIDNSFSGYLFPNPSYNRTIHIHYTNKSVAKHTTLSLYDQTGKLLDMQVEYLVTGEAEIEYHLPTRVSAGLYNIILSNGSGDKQVYRFTQF